jgi:hypothetical protein
MLPKPMLDKVDFETASAAETDEAKLATTTNAAQKIPTFFIVVSS